jgi:hypothetical protein
VSRGEGEKIINYFLNQRIYGNNILVGCVEIKRRDFHGKAFRFGRSTSRGFIVSSSLSPVNWRTERNYAKIGRENL